MYAVLKAVVLIPFLVTAIVAIGVLFVVLKRKRAEAQRQNEFIEGEFVDGEDGSILQESEFEGGEE